MISVSHTNIYRLKDYSLHLRNLADEDKISRFGFLANEMAINHLIIQMIHNPTLHELWYAKIDDEIVGWGHLANNENGSWELAVSVEQQHQRKGVGNKLINEMLMWAKFHHINQVYMHCIEENKVIQHLATKNNLQTKERGLGERTAAIEVPNPSLFEAQTQMWKEYNEILKEFGKLRKRYSQLWSDAIIPKPLL